MSIRRFVVLALMFSFPLHAAYAAGTTDVHGVTLGTNIDAAVQAFGGNCSRLNAGSILCTDGDDPTVSMFVFDLNGKVQSVILNFCSDQPFASVMRDVGERYGVSFEDRSAQEASKPVADQKLPHWDAQTSDVTLVLTPYGNCPDRRPAYRLAMDGRIKVAPLGTPKF